MGWEESSGFSFLSGPLSLQYLVTNRSFCEGTLYGDFLKFIFNCRIIALQCCVGFYHTTTWISYEVEEAQSCLTLCNSMDCSQPGSSVHGILQARKLKWVAIPFSGGSSRPRDWTWVSCITGRCSTIWATREAISISIHTYIYPSSWTSLTHPSPLSHHRAPGKGPVLYSTFPLASYFTHGSVYVSTVKVFLCGRLDGSV